MKEKAPKITFTEQDWHQIDAMVKNPETRVLVSEDQLDFYSSNMEKFESKFDQKEKNFQKKNLKEKVQTNILNKSPKKKKVLRWDGQKEFNNPYAYDGYTYKNKSSRSNTMKTPESQPQKTPEKKTTPQKPDFNQQILAIENEMRQAEQEQDEQRYLAAEQKRKEIVANQQQFQEKQKKQKAEQKRTDKITDLEQQMRQAEANGDNETYTKLEQEWKTLRTQDLEKENNKAQSILNKKQKQLTDLEKKIAKTTNLEKQESLQKDKETLKLEIKAFKSLVNQDAVVHNRAEAAVAEGDINQADKLDAIQKGFDTVANDLDDHVWDTMDDIHNPTESQPLSEDEKMAQELEQEFAGQYRAQAQETALGKSQKQEQKTEGDWNDWLEVQGEVPQEKTKTDLENAQKLALDAFAESNVREAQEKQVQAKINAANSTLLEQQLTQQEQQHPIMKKLGVLGRHLNRLKEGKKGKTWYGKLVEWQNKGDNKYVKLGKRILVSGSLAGGIALATGGVGAAGLAVGAVAGRVAGFTALGGVLGQGFKHLTKKSVERDMRKIQSDFNTEIKAKRGPDAMKIEKDNMSYNRANIDELYTLQNRQRAGETLSDVEKQRLETLNTAFKDNEQLYRDMRLLDRLEKNPIIAGDKVLKTTALHEKFNAKRLAQIKKLKTLEQQGTLTTNQQQRLAMLESGALSPEQKELLTAIQVLRKEQATRFNESRKYLYELRHRRILQNERKAKIVGALPAIAYGGFNLYERISDWDIFDPETPEDKPVVNPEPAPKPETSKISKDIFIHSADTSPTGVDEGITHAFKRQLENSADLRKALNVSDNVTANDLAKVAKRFGYISEDGSDVRVWGGKGAGYELKLDNNGQVSVIEYKDGKIINGEYVNYNQVEVKPIDTQFEGQGIEKIGSSKGEYEYLDNKVKSGNINYQKVKINPDSNFTPLGGDTYEGVKIDPTKTLEVNTGTTQSLRNYPGHRMVVNNMFNAKFNNMPSDRSVMELFRKNGILFHQKNFEMLGWELAKNPSGPDIFVNTNDIGTPNAGKMYSWQDIYEQTNFDQIKQKFSNLDLLETAQNTGNNNGGFNLDNAGTIEEVIAQPKENWVQTAGHYKITGYDDGKIVVNIQPGFKYPGEIETGDFSNREIRLLEKAKFAFKEGEHMPLQGLMPVRGLNYAAIVQLKNGQYAFETVVGTPDKASGLGTATNQLNIAMAQLGMPNITQHHITDPETFSLNGKDTGLYRTRVFTPLSEEQARYIGNIYTTINRSHGMNN